LIASSGAIGNGSVATANSLARSRDFRGYAKGAE
jgi:hypothetical protein